jgi:hypothetical protein
MIGMGAARDGPSKGIALVIGNQNPRQSGKIPNEAKFEGRRSRSEPIAGASVEKYETKPN